MISLKTHAVFQIHFKIKYKSWNAIINKQFHAISETRPLYIKFTDKPIKNFLD